MDDSPFRLAWECKSGGVDAKVEGGSEPPKWDCGGKKGLQEGGTSRA